MKCRDLKKERDELSRITKELEQSATELEKIGKPELAEYIHSANLNVYVALTKVEKELRETE